MIYEQTDLSDHSSCHVSLFVTFISQQCIKTADFLSKTIDGLLVRSALIPAFLFVNGKANSHVFANFMV